MSPFAWEGNSVSRSRESSGPGRPGSNSHVVPRTCQGSVLDKGTDESSGDLRGGARGACGWMTMGMAPEVLVVLPDRLVWSSTESEDSVSSLSYKCFPRCLSVVPETPSRRVSRWVM